MGKIGLLLMGLLIIISGGFFMEVGNAEADCCSINIVVVDFGSYDKYFWASGGGCPNAWPGECSANSDCPPIDDTTITCKSGDIYKSNNTCASTIKGHGISHCTGNGGSDTCYCSMARSNCLNACKDDCSGCTCTETCTDECISGFPPDNTKSGTGDCCGDESCRKCKSGCTWRNPKTLGCDCGCTPTCTGIREKCVSSPTGGNYAGPSGKECCGSGSCYKCDSSYLWGGSSCTLDGCTPDCSGKSCGDDDGCGTGCDIEDCGDGFNCNGITCVADSGGSYGDSCVDDSDCDSGNCGPLGICIFATGSVADGGNCSDDSECVSGDCSGGFCVASPPVICSKGGLIPCGRTCDDDTTKGWNESDPCTLCHLIIMGQLIIEFLVKIAAIFAILAIVGGGLLYVFAAGSQGIIDKAKSMIKYTLLGFLVVFIAWAVIDSILVMMGYIDPINGEWYMMNCGVGTVAVAPPASKICGDGNVDKLNDAGFDEECDTDSSSCGSLVLH